MSKGFYKEDSGVWGYADNFHLPSGDVITTDNYTGQTLPNGYAWYDESPIPSEFDQWENRLAAITDLKKQGQESLLAIPISTFYKTNKSAISDFIKDGSNEFLLTAEASDEAWLDMRTAPDKDSPREILISTLTPLSI